jgi:hypothetical protein
MRRWLMIFALIVACHHDPDPVEPAGTPPLPPASGTPIGFLIDDADLHLSSDQLGKLRDIDTALAAQIDTIDKATRSANKPAPDPSQQQQQPMGRRGRRGGMGGGGGGQRHSGSGAGSAAAAAATGKLADERTEDVKAALERAFALLDPKQQARAKQVLADHDVDLDLDARAAPPSPASAASEEPAPPPPPTLPAPPPTLPPPSQSQQP